MIYFDLESHLGTLYKIEAIFWENGNPNDKFFAVTDADMPDAVRRITGITPERSLGGATERDTVFAFWDFLQRNHAVAPQKIVVNGKAYHKVCCICYGGSRELQKIFLRFGIRIVFDNKERGDLYEYAKTYCDHLPLKSFRQTVVNRYFSIQESELKSLPLLHTALVREATRPITEEECEILVSRLTNLSAKDEDILRSCERIAFDLFRILTVSDRQFTDTLLLLFERTKARPHAEDDWRRIVANVETKVKHAASDSMMKLFDSSLPEQIKSVYPLELSCKILDGEGRIGANLIEIGYRKTKLLVECGLELEPTEPGKTIREKVLRSRYDACLVSHCHADHAGLIDKIEKKTTVYIGPTAKRILQITEKKRYDNVLTFNGQTDIGGITVTPYLCDHSAMDSYMLCFSANGKNILYTGDFRGHGRKSYSALLSRLPQVDILICERTNPDGVKAWSEAKLQEKFEESMRENCDVYVLTGTLNADRIVTIYKACRKTRRPLLVDDSQAYRLNAIGGSIPHPRSHKEIKVVHPSATRKFSGMPPYTMLVRSSMTDALDKLLDTRPNATLIYSMWSGYREKEDIKRLLGIFERRNCPIYTLHTSGHADGDAIQKLIDAVNPKETIFVHGEV